MALAVAVRNAMLDAQFVDGDLASLHTSDPGATGANEATGGSPAYARKVIDWNAASGGAKAFAAAVVFDVPAGTYSHFGVWSSAGVWKGGGALSDSETYPGQGVYTLDSATVSVI
jgi:hypothetical protein